MGSSGADKTTLLDVLARRKTIGVVEDDVFLNNESLMNDFERITVIVDKWMFINLLLLYVKLFVFLLNYVNPAMSLLKKRTSTSSKYSAFGNGRYW
jgi:ABC-type phosphate/phosphonate transport system ATPase subunit